jgi:hypothetical protein
VASYLDIARQGKNDWWRYLVGLLVILLFWFGWGGLFILAPLTLGVVNAAGTGIFDPNDPFRSVPPLLAFNFVLLSFAPLLVGVLLATRLVHKRPFISLITPHQKINWRRLGQGFVIYAILIALAAVVEAWLYPGRYRFDLELPQFILFLLAGLLLFPLQTTAEELLFRGYLLQGLSRLSRQPLLLSSIIGLLFMISHLPNPEIEVNPWLMAANFFAVGFALTLISIKDNGLELALGIHAANNLFSLVAIYPEPSLPIKAIFSVAKLDPVYGLISIVIVYLIFYLVAFSPGLRKKTEGVQPVQAEPFA